MDEDLRKEMLRKSFHFVAGLLFAALIYSGIAVWWHFLSLGIVFSSSMLYIKKTGANVPLISRFISSIGREKEFPGLGSITFIMGALLSSMLFSKYVACASLLVLAIGDAVSPIIGKHFGKIKTIFSKRKLIEGFLAGAGFSFIAIIPIVGVKRAFIGSFIALFAEFWDETDFIDDNILIPLVAGTVMTIVSA